MERRCQRGTRKSLHRALEAGGMGAPMEIHLTHFARKKQGQELVLRTLVGVGPVGITDWVDEYGGELCTQSEKTS